MRTYQLKQRGFYERDVMRVVASKSLPSEWSPACRFLVRCENLQEVRQFQALARAGLQNIYLLISESLENSKIPYLEERVVIDNGNLEDGDVLTVVPKGNLVQVLYRESDCHHTVFLTNRCNSHCLMCSQPPTRQQDDWLQSEALAIARHIRDEPSVIGFTGGEPLLLGTSLRTVLEEFQSLHPDTTFEVLTNGRLFGGRTLAMEIVSGLRAKVTWMIPLFGATDYQHDFVTQMYGSFEETLSGLLNLQEFGQVVQLRLVLIRPVIENIEEIAGFIARNLPFVHDVAFMGCEPTGFALANRSLCDVRVTEYEDVLWSAVRRLELGGIMPILMNIPLCALPSRLRPFAVQSISDWKQTYPEECTGCTVKARCCGFFGRDCVGSRARPYTTRPSVGEGMHEV